MLLVIGSTQSILPRKQNFNISANTVDHKLHSENICVIALHFDGAYHNQSTAILHGYKMEISKIQTWFSYPQIFTHRYMPSLMCAIWQNWWEIVWVTKRYFVMKKMASYKELIATALKHIHIQKDIGFYWQINTRRNILNGQNRKWMLDLLLRHLVLLLLLLLTSKMKVAFQSLG